MLAICSLNTLGGKPFVSGSVSIFFCTYMLESNGVILDFLFHNIKLYVNVFGSTTSLIVVSIKHCWFIVAVYSKWSLNAVYHS